MKMHKNNMIKCILVFLLLLTSCTFKESSELPEKPDINSQEDILGEIKERLNSNQYKAEHKVKAESTNISSEEVLYLLDHIHIDKEVKPKGAKIIHFTIESSKASDLYLTNASELILEDGEGEKAFEISYEFGDEIASLYEYIEGKYQTESLKESWWSEEYSPNHEPSDGVLDPGPISIKEDLYKDADKIYLNNLISGEMLSSTDPDLLKDFKGFLSNITLYDKALKNPPTVLP